MRNSRNGDPRRPPSLSERVYGTLLRAYPRQHREEFGHEMVSFCTELCRDARQNGIAALAWLWASMLLPELLRDAVRERRKQGAELFGVLEVPRRLIVLGGIAAVVAGVISMADGVMSWISMALFIQHPGIPADAPLGLLENQFLNISLTITAIIGLCSIVDRSSSFARSGMTVAGVWATLTLFLTAYDAIADPVYYSDTNFGFGASQSVDQLAVAALQLKMWSLAIAILLLGGAALVQRKLRPGWSVLLLVVSFAQSPLLKQSVFQFWKHSMEYSTQLLSRGSFEMMMTLQSLREVLFHMTFVLPGFSWMLLGWLILSRARKLRSESPSGRVVVDTVQDRG